MDRIFVTEVQYSEIDTGENNGVSYFSTVSTELPLSGLDAPSAVDYDPGSNMIYWTDEDLKTVNRARLDGYLQEVIVRYLGCM